MWGDYTIMVDEFWVRLHRLPTQPVLFPKALSLPVNYSVFTLWYTKIKNLHKTVKFETEKDICPLFGNIRNGNTQKWKIRGNCYTAKLGILQESYNKVYLSISEQKLKTFKKCDWRRCLWHYNMLLFYDSHYNSGVSDFGVKEMSVFCNFPRLTNSQLDRLENYPRMYIYLYIEI